MRTSYCLPGQVNWDGRRSDRHDSQSTTQFPSPTTIAEIRDASNNHAGEHLELGIVAEGVEVGFVRHQVEVVAIHIECSAQTTQRAASLTSETPITCQVVMQDGFVWFAMDCLFEGLDGQLQPPRALVTPCQRQMNMQIARQKFHGSLQRRGRFVVAFRLAERFAEQIACAATLLDERRSALQAIARLFGQPKFQVAFRFADDAADTRIRFGHKNQSHARWAESYMGRSYPSSRHACLDVHAFYAQPAARQSAWEKVAPQVFVRTRLSAPISSFAAMPAVRDRQSVARWTLTPSRRSNCGRDARL